MSQKSDITVGYKSVPYAVAGGTDWIQVQSLTIHLPLPLRAWNIAAFSQSFTLSHLTSQATNLAPNEELHEASRTIVFKPG